MKRCLAISLMLILVSCANGKGKTFTGSTPAGMVVRNFLGIPLTDSVDFIRWLLEVDGSAYKLDCNYGIGKPNTNGFINGGNLIKFTGTVQKEKTSLLFINGKKQLRFSILNNSVLHPLDEQNNFLAGTGGWSYTLATLNPQVEPLINIPQADLQIKDSASYVGRTPCGIPGVVKKDCYKLKWHLILYGSTAKDEPGRYRLRGTLYGLETKTGTWTANKTEDGAVHYQLMDEKNKAIFHFVKGGEQVLFMTDSNGKLLAGDEDFSYTLSRGN